MGALFQGQCFSSASEAAHLFFSAQPHVVVPGSVTYHALFKLDAGVWSRLVYEDSVLVASAVMDAPDFPVCDPADSVADGMTLAFGVVACWVTAYVFRLMGWSAGGR